MDPNACLKRFYDACTDGDHEEMQEAYRDLCRWLFNGGFEPNWTEIAADYPGQTVHTRQTFEVLGDE